jgi:hypothetical protein
MSTAADERPVPEKFNLKILYDLIIRELDRVTAGGGITFATDFKEKRSIINDALRRVHQADTPGTRPQSEAVLHFWRDILSSSIARLPFWWSRITDESGATVTTMTHLDGRTPDSNPPVRPVKRVLDFINSPAASPERILILKAATGSGKSTMIPTSYILNAQRDLQDNSAYTPRRMYVTQPRRLNTMEISTSVAQMTGSFRYRKIPKNETEEEVAARWARDADRPDEPPPTDPKARIDPTMIDLHPQVIGFMTGDRKRNRNASVIFVTEGLMAHLIRKAPKRYLGDDAVIVIDEVHERNIETDQLIFEIFSYLESRRLKGKSLGNFRIIIMSATFSPEQFRNYFTVNIGGSPLLRGAQAPCRIVKGTAAKVHVRFTSMPVPDVARAAAERIARIHVRDQGRLQPATDQDVYRDIIAFVPGVAMADSIKRYLYRLIPAMQSNGDLEGAGDDIERALVIDVNSSMPDTTITKRPLYEFGNGSARRRIFLATDFAETGVTFEQLKFVVDLGLRNSVTFDPLNGIRVSSLVPVSRNSARQRRGRVGRVSEGYCYHLYTEEYFNDHMEEETPPKISTDVRAAEMCMRFIAEGYMPTERHLLTRITPEQEMYSFGLLWSLGMIRITEHDTGEPVFMKAPEYTQLGYDYLSIVRVGSPENGKCVLAAAALDPTIMLPMVISLVVYDKLGSRAKFPSVVPLQKENSRGEPVTRLFRSDFLNYYEFYRQYNTLLKKPRDERKRWEREILMRGISAMHPREFAFPSVEEMKGITGDIEKIWKRITATPKVGELAERGSPESLEPLTHNQQLAFCRSIISGFHFNRAKLSACRDYYECRSRRDLSGSGILLRAASIYANNTVTSPNPHQIHRARYIVFAGLEWRSEFEYPIATGVTVLDRMAVLPATA